MHKDELCAMLYWGRNVVRVRTTQQCSVCDPAELISYIQV
jgi:hypothetical protein